MLARTDVVVVGGGPAGLATGIELRRRGLEVLVVDRSQPPIDKACGEGLMPDGVRRLEEMGVDLSGVETGSIAGICYIDEDSRAEASFRRGHGLGIRRPVLHRAKVARAEQVGVECLWGQTVRSLEAGGVSTDQGSIRATWTVGADGLHSRVRRWAGLESERRRWQRFGVRRHYAVEPWTDKVEVYWADKGEAYVTPVGPEHVGIAILWSGTKSNFSSLLKGFPELERRVMGSTAVSEDRGSAQLEQRTRGVHRGSVALVGDAAGYRDAITGEGLSLAFHQAKALAEAIDSNELGDYERAVHRLSRLPNALIRILLEIESRPRLRSRLLRTLAADASLFERLLAIHVREARPTSVGPGGVMRLALGLLH